MRIEKDGHIWESEYGIIPDGTRCLRCGRRVEHYENFVLMNASKEQLICEKSDRK